MWRETHDRKTSPSLVLLTGLVNWKIKFKAVFQDVVKRIGGSKGCQGCTPSHPTPSPPLPILGKFFFHVHAFLGKIPQNNKLLPSFFRLPPLPRGNPGSATRVHCTFWFDLCFDSTKKNAKSHIFSSGQVWFPIAIIRDPCNCRCSPWRVARVPKYVVTF